MTKKNIILTLVTLVLLFAGFVGWQQFNNRINTNSDASAKKTNSSESKTLNPNSEYSKPKIEAPLPASVKTTKNNSNPETQNDNPVISKQIDINDDDKETDQIIKDIEIGEQSSSQPKK